MNTDKKIIQGFLLKYQEELIHRAETIGLMSHAATNGMLKEYIVKSVLKLILPSNCEVCSGIVFDGKGGKSKQIDIIIFDKRSPKFEFSEGVGYYPIEGVLACIEVKSSLDKDGLYSALSNSLSVLRLYPILCGKIKIAEGDKWIEPETHDGARKAIYQYSPGTYIFSFDSVTVDTASIHIEEWIKANKTDITDVNFARLPRCIIGKEWVSMLDDSYIEISKEILQNAKTENAIFCFNTKNTFLYFISHLLHKIALRIKMSQGVTDAYFSINEMLPINDLLLMDQITNIGQIKFISF